MANLLPLHMHNMRLPRCSNFRTFTLTAKAASSNGVPFNNNNNISGTSKSGGGRGPVILEIPMDKIRRPLMRTRSNDPEKVKDLMDSIQQIGLQVPIDVLEVDGVYYGFSGCHRYEAHQRLGLPTIRCKVRRGTKETLSDGGLNPLPAFPNPSEELTKQLGQWKRNFLVNWTQCAASR